MPDRIEFTKSDFVSVLAAVASPCSSFLPGEEPIPGWLDPDPEACEHFLQMIAVMKAADIVIDRTLRQLRLGRTLGERGLDAMLADSRFDLQRFVDDICRTPPRWPLPWPPPSRPLKPQGLTPTQLLVAGARFHAASDHVEDDALRPELATTADRLFDAGLARLSEPAGPRPA